MNAGTDFQNEIFLNGQRYQVVMQDDQLVGSKRFDKKYGMWVVIKFSDDVHAEAELLNLLKAEYIRRQLSDAPTL